MRWFAACILLAVMLPLRAEVPAWIDEPIEIVRLIEQAHRASTQRRHYDAAQLYCVAAAHGSLEAQFQLGRLYLGPLRASRGRESGQVLLALAAQRGHARAEVLLASMTTPPPLDVDRHLPPCLFASSALPHADAETVVPHEVVEHYVAGLPQAHRTHARLVQRLAPRFKVDARLALAITRAESNFDPNARSPRNAMGLMQLIPDTVDRFGVRDPFDPEQNVRGGLAYLRWLIARYDGDIERVASAYNAGEGAVDRYGGVPPYAETEAYVRRILAFYRARRHALNP